MTKVWVLTTVDQDEPGVDVSVFADASEAVEAFDELVESMGGSQGDIDGTEADGLLVAELDFARFTLKLVDLIG